MLLVVPTFNFKNPFTVAVPVIDGLVNDLLVNVWISVNWTILALVISVIFVAVSAFPVNSPMKEVAVVEPSIFASPCYNTNSFFPR